MGVVTMLLCLGDQYGLYFVVEAVDIYSFIGHQLRRLQIRSL